MLETSKIFAFSQLVFGSSFSMLVFFDFALLTYLDLFLVGFVITTTLVPTWSNYTISKIGTATNAYTEVFLARDNGSANANNVWVTSVFWVPTGYYYRVDAFNHQNNNVNSSSTVRTWSELTFS